LALALSLPATLGPERELIRVMAFGVVLFTLLVQSTTMKPLLRWLHVTTRDPLQTEYELRHARMMAFRAAALHLDRMQRDGFISQPAWESLKPELIGQAEDMAGAVRELQRVHPELAAEELESVRRELLRAQRGTLLGLRRDGVIAEEVFEQLVAEIDTGLTGEVATEETEGEEAAMPMS
jgi:CPA1 family monovalent cation:H+ antiporter